MYLIDGCAGQLNPTVTCIRAITNEIRVHRAVALAQA